MGPLTIVRECLQLPESSGDVQIRLGKSKQQTQSRQSRLLAWPKKETRPHLASTKLRGTKNETTGFQHSPGNPTDDLCVPYTPSR